MGLFSGSFYSEKLKTTTRIQVIFPDESNDVTPVMNGTPRVLYLLHGLGGNCEEWTRFSKIEYYAKKYNFIIIMPEVQRSFYCNTSYAVDYLSYVADELPSICNRWFRLDPRKENTFIAGESMGGYGAAKIGLSRPNRYGAIAALSGVMDYASLCCRVLNGEWSDILPQELHGIHGAIGMPAKKDDLLHLVQKTAMLSWRPRLLQMCGTEDFLYEDNQTFRMIAQKAEYGHTYLEGPGDHEWPYWDKAIQRAFQFFCELDMETTPLY